MTGRLIFAVLMVCMGNLAYAQPKAESTRGELLYSTHCIACHDDQVHWRDKKIAKDWNGLKAQVRRWQGVQGLVWGDERYTGRGAFPECPLLQLSGTRSIVIPYDSGYPRSHVEYRNAS